MIAEAKAKAAASTETILAAAQVKFNAQLAEAEAQIAEARNSAMAEVESVAAEATILWHALPEPRSTSGRRVLRFRR